MPATVPEMTVTFTGRLDNRDELIRALQLDKRISDTDIVSQAFAAWAEAAPEKLIGAFSLVIRDQHSNEIFAATDHLATRRLFYAETVDGLRIASTIRKLLDDPGVSNELDDDFLTASLVIPSVAPLQSDRTPYRAIRRVPPGSRLTAKPGTRPKVVRYWRPETLESLHSKRFEDLADEFRQVFEVAVRAQLRSTAKPAGGKPPLITLSGGLDSSAIACVAMQHSDLDAFHFTYAEAPGIDESKFRSLVTDDYGLGSTELKSETWMFRGMFDDGVGLSIDEPFAASTARHQYAEAAGFAADTGHDIVLYGVGGDELMSGSENHLADLLLQGKLGAFAQSVRALGRMPNRTFASTAWLSGIAPIFRNRMTSHAIVRGSEGRPPRPEAWWLYGWPGWVRNTKLSRSGVQKILDSLPERHISRQPGRAQCAESFYRNTAISQWNDSLFGPAGAEMRCPFYDRRVVELALAIPEAMKLEIVDGKFLGKLVLREAMKGILPERLRQRRGKAKFDALAQVGAEREAPGLLASKRFEVVERGYVDGPALRESLRAWRVGQWTDLPRLSLLLAVESWLRARG